MYCIVYICTDACIYLKWFWSGKTFSECLSLIKTTLLLLRNNKGKGTSTPRILLHSCNIIYIISHYRLTLCLLPHIYIYMYLHSGPCTLHVFVFLEQTLTIPKLNVNKLMQVKYLIKITVHIRNITCYICVLIIIYN